MLCTLFMCVALLNLAGVVLFLPVVVISSRAAARTLWQFSSMMKWFAVEVHSLG